ncbi:MAG: hypothetical protein IKJ55_03590 [Clostridia bacterium]|nr:hypothetical protein [Clostridia bacterium]
MEVTLVTIINILFVPMFATTIYCKRHQLLQEEFKFRILAIYMMMTAALVPIMKGVEYLISFCFGYKLEIYSGYYTIGAVVVAVILPYVVELIQKCFAVECEIKK